jgi:hypothetical protein
MLKAAEQALRELRRPQDVARARGKIVSEVLPWAPPAEKSDEPEAPAASTAPVEEPAAADVPATPEETPAVEAKPAAEAPAAEEPTDAEA